MKARMRKQPTEPDRMVHDDQASQDDVLAIIVDVSSGHEYYMSFVDAFKMNGHEYMVMYNYEPDDGQHVDPEIIILRSERHLDGEQYFLSIKNRKELNAAFDLFFKRFADSGSI